MLDKEAESHACISETFLAHLNTSASTTSCSSVATLPTTSLSSGNLCGSAAGGGTITKSVSTSSTNAHGNNVNNTHA